MAWGLVTLAEHDAAQGGVWHLPADEPVTGRQFIGTVFDVLRRPARMRAISRSMMRLAGIFSSTIRESAEVLYQFERPFIVDSSKFERAFGKSVTPHAAAVARTIEAIQRST